jgi:hypothetical protein
MDRLGIDSGYCGCISVFRIELYKCAITFPAAMSDRTSLLSVPTR